MASTIARSAVVIALAACGARGDTTVAPEVAAVSEPRTAPGGQAPAMAATAADPTFIEPPRHETPSVTALIDRAISELAASRTTPSEILADPLYMTLHERPRFRHAIRAFATDDPITLVPSDEPGERMILAGAVRDATGKPAVGALIYAYQTSARGWYADRAHHIAGPSGDHGHSRLFGYVRTDVEGRFEIRTIRPGSYPGTELPAHIHIEIARRNGPALVSEIRFADDPRMTRAMRRRSAADGFLVLPVERDARGVQRVHADFRL